MRDIKKEVKYEQLELLEALEKGLGMVPDFSRIFLNSPDVHHSFMGFDGSTDKHDVSSQPYIELEFQTISLYFAV